MVRTIGLFGSDADATEASDALHSAGYGDDMEVVDRARVVAEHPTDLVVGGTSGEPLGVLRDKHEEEPLTRENIAEYLDDFGLGPEEAMFYAERLLGQSSMIIVDGDEDRVDEAANIMEEKGGRVDAF